MKTLIELYDDRPIENVLATEMFHPEETVFICPPEVEADKAYKKSLERYFEHRKCPVKLTFMPVSLLDAGKIGKRLLNVLETHEDCAIEIAGGTDAALFAAGAVAGETPVFTYSRKKNSFFDIKNAPFARNVPCTVRLDAESCFLMAGGTLLPGRVDQKTLADRMPMIGKLFDVYAGHRRIWQRQVSYIQRLGMLEGDPLTAAGAITEKADHGRVTADRHLFRALAAEGLIYDLDLREDGLSFRYPDENIRFWLRDIGAVLELQVYRACLAAGCFDDVVISAVVNWESGDLARDSVSNEIDVVAVRGVQPVIISCKTCEIHTQALNELSVLRDRFGGRGSRALIVTSAPVTGSRSVMRRRAQELGIEVIEWSDIRLDILTKRLRGR